MAKQPHAYWEHQFLHVAGLPVSGENVFFLLDWASNGDDFGCAYNPLTLSHREPGSKRCHKLPNGQTAQTYTDTASAANAFAAQINSGDYPDLRKAFESKDPYGYSNASGVALNLQRWGADKFQAYFDQHQGAQAVGVGTGPVPHSKNVGAAWGNLMRTFAHDGHRTIVELQKATASLSRIERRLRRA